MTVAAVRAMPNREFQEWVAYTAWQDIDRRRAERRQNRKG